MLDEADRMLDMGFIRDINKIVPALPTVRQSLMFSATMPPRLLDWRRSCLSNQFVSRSLLRLSQLSRWLSMFVVFLPRKRRILEEIVANPNCKRVIIFVKMKHRTNRIADQLQKVGIETVNKRQ